LNINLFKCTVYTTAFIDIRSQGSHGLNRVSHIDRDTRKDPIDFWEKIVCYEGFVFISPFFGYLC